MKKSQIFTLFLMISSLSFSAFTNIKINLTGNLPPSVNNAATQHFRSIFGQLGMSCGNACGIGYVFTYEINAAHNTSATSESNQYPYTYTYHFLNSGSSEIGTYQMFKDAWLIAQENGIPSVSDFGGFTSGYPTKWLSGYDKYYNGMKNRVDIYDSVGIKSEASLDTIKQWLVDHGNGSSVGGVVVIPGNTHGIEATKIRSGAETGKIIALRFGTDLNSPHAYTIVGYNDNIQYDFNGDGKFTNNTDITNDGIVNMQDWEIGAFRIANSWGTSAWDQGFAYLPYRILTMTPADGGPVNNNTLYICSARKEYTVRSALKVSITHTTRNAIALSVGISSKIASIAPEKTRTFQKQFTYSGGALPMGGTSSTATIEIGLDVSDLLDSIDATKSYRVFLNVASKGGSGTINSLSLMDYTSGKLVEIPSEQKNVSVTNGTTHISVANDITSKSQTRLKKIDTDGIDVHYANSSLLIKSAIPGSKQFVLSDLQGKQHVSSLVTGNQQLYLKKPLLAGSYIVSIRNACGLILLQKKLLIQ